MSDRIDIRDVFSRFEELEEILIVTYNKKLETEQDDEAELLADEESDNKEFLNWLSEDIIPDENNDLISEAEEFYDLKNLLGELHGRGGDEKWRGDWYPLELIRDSYFETYAQELAEETGAIPNDVSWPCNCIDWEKATRELKMDYSSVDVDDVEYWYRA